MKKIALVLALMAIPQVMGLSTLCNAGPQIACPSNADGSCKTEGLMCGAYSQDKHCTTIGGTTPLAAAKKTPPQGLSCVCQ